MRTFMVASAFALLAPAVVSAADRPMVNIECMPTDQKLVYHCKFEVMGNKSHQPVDGASFKVNADMASMPMAHNVMPIEPQPVAGKAGTYQGHLELEMMGEWTLKMTFSKPVRDVVIRKLMFGDAAMKMDHSKHNDHGTETKSE